MTNVRPRMIFRLLTPLVLVIALGATVGAQVNADSRPQPTTALPDVAAAVAKLTVGEIEATVRTLVGFGTRHTLSEGPPGAASRPADPASRPRGIGAARQWIHAEMARAAAGTLAFVQSETHLAPVGERVPEPVEMVNVITTIPGTDSRRAIVISGHYDSICTKIMDATSDAPGANDDASGTAVIMACARALAGTHPRASILCAAVPGEEQGLLGAAALARQLRDEGRDVVLMITNDIVGGVIGANGRREPLVVRCFSEGVPSGPKDDRGRITRTVTGSDSDSPSRQIARYLAARAPLYVPGFDVRLIFRQDRYLRGGDHKAFNDLGFAAVRLTEPNENWDWQHQDVRTVGDRAYGDLPEHVDFAFVRRVAAVNLAVALEVALAPASPRQVAMDALKLSPHTLLRWKDGDASEAPDTRYAVLMRRTHEPLWTDRIVVPAGALEITIENTSKDDWLFAVEAFDAAGHRSLPVYPTPALAARRGQRAAGAATGAGDGK